jgi:hypothetical protein
VLKRQSEVELTANYPMVRCATHPGTPRPGYSVCEHVANGADVAIHYAPTESDLGHVVCKRCYEDELSAYSLRLTRVANALELQCAECVFYHLGDRLPPCEVSKHLHQVVQ